MNTKIRTTILRRGALASFTLTSLGVVVTWCLAVHNALAQSVETVRLTAETAKAMNWAFCASALAVGLGSIAAGIAVAYVGAAAIGAISEKPEVTGKVLIFVGLAEGIAIYGLIIAIMILGKV